MAIRTGLPLPRLERPRFGVGSRVLGDLEGARFVVLVFYRGLHCWCRNPHLTVSQSLLPRFRDLGAEVIAVSSDEKSRAAQSVAD